MATNYNERLKLPVEGNDDVTFLTHCGCRLAQGYTRVIIGGRGPYVEFADRHILRENIRIPEDARWRLKSDRAFYVEWRSVCSDNVKIYYQRKLVDYADYKVAMWYISPFDLMSLQYPVLIEKLTRGFPLL